MGCNSIRPVLLYWSIYNARRTIDIKTTCAVLFQDLQQYLNYKMSVSFFFSYCASPFFPHINWRKINTKVVNEKKFEIGFLLITLVVVVIFLTNNKDRSNFEDVGKRKVTMNSQTISYHVHSRRSQTKDLKKNPSVFGRDEREQTFVFIIPKKKKTQQLPYIFYRENLMVNSFSRFFFFYCNELKKLSTSQL